MIYAEKITGTGIEKGVFLSFSEFLPYRCDGWISTAENNAIADTELKRLARLSDKTLKYLSPMIGMDRERWELCRRQNENN